MAPPRGLMGGPAPAPGPRPGRQHRRPRLVSASDRPARPGGQPAGLTRGSAHFAGRSLTPSTVAGQPAGLTRGLGAPHEAATHAVGGGVDRRSSSATTEAHGPDRLPEQGRGPHRDRGHRGGQLLRARSRSRSRFSSQRGQAPRLAACFRPLIPTDCAASPEPAFCVNRPGRRATAARLGCCDGAVVLEAEGVIRTAGLKSFSEEPFDRGRPGRQRTRGDEGPMRAASQVRPAELTALIGRDYGLGLRPYRQTHARHECLELRSQAAYWPAFWQ